MHIAQIKRRRAFAERLVLHGENVVEALVSLENRQPLIKPLEQVLLVRFGIHVERRRLLPPETFQAVLEDEGDAHAARLRVVLDFPRLFTIIALILVVWALNPLIAIWILTQGGPAGATSTMPIYIYSAFRDFNLSAASAASCLLLAVSLVFAGVYVLRVTKEA